MIEGSRVKMLEEAVVQEESEAAHDHNPFPPPRSEILEMRRLCCKGMKGITCGQKLANLKK